MQMYGLLASAAKSVSLLVLLLQMVGDVATAQAEEPVPYLLFTTQNSIRRIYLNGSADVQTLLGPTPGQIQKIDYHYRMNYMFWIDGQARRRKIMRAELDGSKVTTLLRDLNDPIDLAVDWLNDKLYWIDAGLRLIEEYDIATGDRRIVTSTGASSTSQPAALALYPYPNYGWLYWSDITNHSIEMVSVTGDGRSTIATDKFCVTAISVDYANHTLYWIDRCTFSIESLRLDGDSSALSVPASSIIIFPSALTPYNGLVYYAQGRGIFRMDPEGGTAEVRLYGTSGTRATGVQVVHPSRQPSAQVYVEIVTTVEDGFTFECSEGCINGKCIPPGLCGCNSGWRGVACDIDIPECSDVNGGCGHTCLEHNGGFQCTCFDGYVLAYDGRTCVDECQTPIVTVNAVRPTSATFDPCLTYIRETPSTSVLTRAISTTSSSLIKIEPTSSSRLASSSMSSSPTAPTYSSLYSSVDVEMAPTPTTTVVFLTSTAASPTSVEPSPTASPPSYTRPPVSAPPPNLQPSSSTTTTVIIEPTLVVVEAVKTEDDGILLGFGLYVLIGIGGGLALAIVFIIIAVVIVVVLCVRYKRRRNRSWSPQKSFKSNSSTHIDTMVSVKPAANGHSNGNVVVLSKAEEAELELDSKSIQLDGNVA